MQQFETIGKLTIMFEVPRTGKHLQVKCWCDCGRSCVIPLYRVRSGLTRSCGCLAGTKTEHAHARRGKLTETYKSWRSMHRRCKDQKGHHAKYYFERGITVCNEWVDYAKFLEDMGERPAGMTLDRIDNEKGYTKDNCRWADKFTQSRNRRKFR